MEIHEGDLVEVKTRRGTGLFMCRADGTHQYLQEVEKGTVRRVTGHGGCVMPARPGAGVAVEKVSGKQVRTEQNQFR